MPLHLDGVTDVGPALRAQLHDVGIAATAELLAANEADEGRQLRRLAVGAAEGSEQNTLRAVGRAPLLRSKRRVRPRRR